MLRAAFSSFSCIVILATNRGLVKGNCTDFKNQPVPPGQRYIPRNFDPCTTCTCDNGHPIMCNSVLCSPPKNCPNSQLADDKCCQFMCQNGSDNSRYPVFNVTTIETEETEVVNTTNLGLRLVASTVTSFLILALLLFMIHRLRQRRLFLMIRRFNNNHLNTGLCDQQYAVNENGSVEYFTHQDHVAFSYFEDPPPPYTFWKPPEFYYSHGEAPPSYEMALSPNSHFASSVPPTSRSISSSQGLINHLPLHSLNNISLHANNFQMNDLGRERSSSHYSDTVSPLPLNVVGSVSSSSSHSDLNFHNSSNSNNDIADTMAIRSDATYEQFPSYGSNQILSGSNASVVSERDHRNSIELPSAHVGTAPSALKCHSCSDVVDCLQDINCQRHELPKSLKRYSLQSPLSGMRSLGPSYPDSPAWIGDASESSSSSSPSYEQQTASPTSSDSSSIDYHLTKDSDQNKLVCGVSKMPVSSHVVHCNENANSKNHLSFEKTFSHIKKKVLLKKTVKLPGKDNDKGKKKDLNVDPKTSGHDDIQQAGASHQNLDVYSRVPRISYVNKEDNCLEGFACGETKLYHPTKLKPFTNYDANNGDPFLNKEGQTTKEISKQDDSEHCSGTSSDGNNLNRGDNSGKNRASSSTEEGGAALDYIHSSSKETSPTTSNQSSYSSNGSHSRNVSICSETGEHRPTNLCTSSASDSRLRNVPVCASVRHLQQIRSNGKTRVENNESYI